MNGSPARNPFAFLYNHNPFYLLSSLAVLYSLHRWQGSMHLATSDSLFVALIAVLSTFTLLLGVIGVAIVRLGGVWEDARSIFLSILLIAVAVSVSLDHLCIRNPWLAIVGMSCSFVFLAILSEAVFRILAIRFPGRYRFSYYLILAVLFFYPVLFSPHLLGVNNFNSSWLILGFGFVSGAAILSLLPAVANGSAYVANNGTPWSWPSWPWAIFGVLFLALVLRTFTLCLSFVPQFGNESGFSPVFLLPIAFALMTLALQGSLVSGQRENQAMLMVCAIPLFLLTSLNIESGAHAQQFRWVLASTIGSPLYLSILALVFFYLVAWIGEVRGARTMFVLLLMVSGFVPASATHFTGIELVNWWPLVLAGVLQLESSYRENCALRGAWAMAAFVLAGDAMLATWLSIDPAPVFVGTSWLLMVLVLSSVMNDRWAHLIRITFALLIPCALLCVALATWMQAVPESSTLYCSAAMTLACMAVYKVTRTSIYLPAAFVCLLVCVAQGAWRWSHRIQGLPDEVRYGLYFSIGCLLAGFVISFSKAGWTRRICNAIGKTFTDSVSAIPRNEVECEYGGQATG